MIDEMILNNLVGELKRGTQVLAVLAHLHHGQYGYSLLQDLTDKGVQIEAGTLYPLLRRLEAQGLLKSDWDTSEARPRKYYVLSDDGVTTFHALRREWQKLTEDMNAVLKETNDGK
jgi:PadR family transcriptional regulator, regulatory protein PadR